MTSIHTTLEQTLDGSAMFVLYILTDGNHTDLVIDTPGIAWSRA